MTMTARETVRSTPTNRHEQPDTMKLFGIEHSEQRGHPVDTATTQAAPATLPPLNDLLAMATEYRIPRRGDYDQRVHQFPYVVVQKRRMELWVVIVGVHLIGRDGMRHDEMRESIEDTRAEWRDHFDATHYPLADAIELAYDIAERLS